MWGNTRTSDRLSTSRSIFLQLFHLSRLVFVKCPQILIPRGNFCIHSYNVTHFRFVCVWRKLTQDIQALCSFVECAADLMSRCFMRCVLYLEISCPYMLYTVSAFKYLFTREHVNTCEESAYKDNDNFLWPQFETKGHFMNQFCDKLFAIILFKWIRLPASLLNSENVQLKSIYRNRK
jgi:hypothetical protein